MKKGKKKLMITAMTAMVACTLTSGLVMTSFADEATKDHEFDTRKGDIVFEDFDRESLEGIVSTTTEDRTDLGEKPYLHVEFDAMDEFTVDKDDDNYESLWHDYCNERNGWIFKQGSSNLAGVESKGFIRITMRGDVALSDLCFGVRGIDTEEAVFVKSFTDVTRGTLDPEEWSTYEISFASAYESEDLYPTTESDTVIGTPLAGIHIFPAPNVSGTVDIKSIEYRKTGAYSYLNDFTGGDTVVDTGKAADPGYYWAGSKTGHIVKRIPTIEKGGDLIVLKESAVGDYAYAVIEAVGDVENLKVATTTGGKDDFGDAVAYDGYSIALTGEEKGFKFTYDGEDSVGIKRIYLTNLEAVIPDVATPVIDARTAKYLDDFSVAQSGISGVWEDMSTAPEAAQAGMQYRLSYANADKLEIKDGMLVMEAPQTGFTNFKFKSQKAYTQKYLVLKMKLEGEGANLDKSRFVMITQDDRTSKELSFNALKSGVEYNSKLLDESNPYRDGEWYYVVVDLVESTGADIPEVGYSGMDMYFEGTGTLYVDEIFFADKKDLPPILANDVKSDGSAEFKAESAGDYEQGYVWLNNLDGKGTQIKFDITPATDDFNISAFRIQFEGVGTYWGSENAQGTFITVDGKKLNELTYTKGQPTTVVIDLAASGIEGAFQHLHVFSDNIQKFTMNNVSVQTYVDPYEAKELDTAHNVVDADEKEFTPTKPGYEGAFGYGIPENVYGKLAFTLTPGEGFDPTAFRFTCPGEYWIAQHPDDVMTADGKKFSEIEFTAGTPINFVIDLEAIGATSAFNEVYFHTAGTDTGSFTISDFAITPYKYLIDEYYQNELDKLPTYLETEEPTVTITTATTAKEGDKITVKYTASDNMTSAADLKVEITVTKDGKEVALNNGTFTAKEGVYTVTVKVTDLAGNEATDVKQITVSKAEDSGLSTGAIVGIVIGCVLGVGLIAGCVVLALRKKKKANKKEDKE